MRYWWLLSAQKIRSSEFNRNVFTLVFGTSLAQLLTFLMYPLISRLYTPDAFGVFGVFLSVTGMVALIATGRYELSIILPSTKNDAYNLFGLSFLINSAVSLLSLLVVAVIYLSGFHFGSEYNMLQTALWLAPPVIFLTSASNILQNWFIRSKSFKLLSASKIITSIANNGIAVLLGLVSAGFWGLLAGLIVSLLFVTGFFMLNFWRNNAQKDLTFNKHLCKTLAHKYSDFPKANTWHALSDMFQSQGIIYFLAIFFSSGTVGLYAFAMRILQAPVMLIVNSFSQVFYQSASERYNRNEDLMPLLKSTVLKVSAVSLPVMAVLMLFGPDIFALVFSEKWREAGVYARILAPWICIDFIRYAMAQMPVVLGKIRQVLLWSVLGNVIIAISLSTGSLLTGNIIDSFILLSAAMSIYLILLILWIFKITAHASRR
jgi:O-antigen/teichoic acid export membrane protein